VAIRMERRKNGNSFIMMHKLTFDATCHVASQLCNNSSSYFVYQNLWGQLMSFCGCATSELTICVQWSKLLYYSTHLDCGSVEKQFLRDCFISQIISTNCFQWITTEYGNYELEH
jgi:hypothetical protein